MEVRFYNHLADPPFTDQKSIARWLDVAEAPVKDDFVQIGGKTWVVRYRVWRPSGLRVDVVCSQWEFNL